MAYKEPTFQEATEKRWSSSEILRFDPKTIGPKTKEVYESAKRDGRPMGGSNYIAQSTATKVASARMLTEESTVANHPWGANGVHLIVDFYEKATMPDGKTPKDFRTWDARLGQELGDLCNEIGVAVLDDLGFTYGEAQERHTLYSRLVEEQKKEKDKSQSGTR